MSSVTHSLPSSSTEPKKKFGTNLNKLTKPPPAPPSASFQTHASRGGQQLPSSSLSSRSGLLVLSTKRNSATTLGLLGIASKGKAAGTLPSGGAAPKPINTPSLRSESLSSYDALQMTGSTGGRGSAGDVSAGAAGATQQTAWGVVDKGVATNSTGPHGGTGSGMPLPVLAPKGGIGYDRRRVAGEEISNLKRGASSAMTMNGLPSKNPPKLPHAAPTSSRPPSVFTSQQSTSAELTEAATEPPPTSPANTENSVTELAAEGIVPKNSETLSKATANDDRRAESEESKPTPTPTPKHASRPTKAKERAEIRRAEEMALEIERRDRAARRLKELQDNITSAVIPQDILVTTNAAPPSIKKSSRQTVNSKDSEVVLELLGPKHSGGGATKGGKHPNEGLLDDHSPNKANVMFKPTKTFSSLVGGTGHKLDQPPVLQQPPAAASVEEGPPVPFIQLSGFDDRDRGERAGPRMLFDPKSGSMVAAPSDKRALLKYNNSSKDEPKPRKDRPKLKPRPARDKDASNPQPVVIAKPLHYEDPFPRKTNKSTEDIPAEDFDSRTRRTHSFRTQNYNSKLNTFPSEPPNLTNTLPVAKPNTPRTCGVLYKLDTNGNYISADGCDPDQGFGSHSVPGGRTRYPHAYAKYLEQQQASYNAAVTKSTLNGHTYNISRTVTTTNNQHNHRNIDSDSQKLGFYPYDQTTTKYFHNKDTLSTNKMANTVLKQNHPLPLTKNQPLDYNYTLPSSSIRIKTEPKSISIITGDPESPELQATANPWAPNEAALAAAAAVFANAASNAPVETACPQQLPAFDLVSTNAMHEVAMDSLSNTDQEECEVSQSFEGLGFDPTENMDTVIMSPSVRSADNDNNLDFQSLTLNPDLPTITSSENLKPFAPLSPSRLLDASTWATAGVSLSRSPGRIGSAIGGVGPSASTLNWNLLGAESSNTETPPPHHLRPSQQPTSTNSSLPTTSTNAPPAASFLSLSPLHHDGVVNWGALGGIDIAGLSMRHTKGSEDTSE